MCKRQSGLVGLKALQEQGHGSEESTGGEWGARELRRWHGVDISMGDSQWGLSASPPHTFGSCWEGSMCRSCGSKPLGAVSQPSSPTAAHRSLFPLRSLTLLSGRRHELSPPTPAELEIEKVPFFFFGSSWSRGNESFCLRVTLSGS